MKRFNICMTALIALCVTTFAHATLPTLILKNQFGEQSNNYILGGSGSVTGCTTANTVVSNITGSSAAPLCNTYAAVSAKLLPTQLLTGYTSGAGAVAGTDTVLQAIQKLNGNGALVTNGTFTPTSEAVIAAGAISTTKMLSTVSNVTVGTYAVTLAAPSSQDGQLKIIKAVATMTHTVTLAMTNISMSGGYTPAGTTTLTFTSAGDSAVFIAVGAKWVYLGGSAVAT